MATTASGSAGVQGRLWSTRARDFTTLEPKMIALYEAALANLKVGEGTRLLDVGCGAGFFLRLAAQKGACVNGIDAAEALIAIADERVPEAELLTGEMEALPYADDSFDAVTGFDAFHLAADPARALLEAGRVARPGAPVLISSWGRSEHCEAAGYLAAVGALEAFALSEPGKLEQLASKAALSRKERHEVLCVWSFADDTTALRALGSTGFAVRAAAQAGEDAIAAAVLEAIAPYGTSDGGYRLENTFTYLIASA